MATNAFDLVLRPSAQSAEWTSLLLVLLACAVDGYTGSAYSPLLFYVPALTYAAWFSGGRFGWLYVGIVGVGMASVGLAGVDRTAADIETALFNAVSRFSTATFVYWVVRRLHDEMLALRAAKRRLEILDEERNKLFGVISHDLRSPFTALLGYTDLLEHALHSGAVERVKECARLCREAAHSAYALLENLLEWARLRLDNASLTPGQLDVGNLLHDAVESQHAAAALKGVGLRIDPTEPGLHGFADRRASETVLRNLVSNAIKFTPSGGLVTISARVAHGGVEFSVRDTGVGISASRLAGLFTIGTKQSTTGTDGEPGTGLGLLLCKDLVERSGGQLAVESDVDKGSCFRFTMPGQPK